MRQTNQAGVDLIREFEGLRLTVYLDPVGLPTVGYGHLVRPADNLKVGDVITLERAVELLRSDLSNAEKAVTEMTGVELTDNQFAALVSLVYNIGSGNYAKSSVLRHLNAGQYKLAAQAFLMWIRAGRPLRVLPGLVRRRKAERTLFLESEHAQTE